MTVLFLLYAMCVRPAWAQGDFAPYQSPGQLHHVLSQNDQIKKKVLRRRPRDTGQNAVVKTDGAAIYFAPNFDAPVLGYLDSGKRIRVSKTMYPGIGGLGDFYRVHVGRHRFGYITDTDIILRHPARGDVVKNGPLDTDDQKDQDSADLYLSRYGGLTYYNYNFSEKISGGARSAPTAMYGFKFTGPTSLMGGLPLDFDLLFTSVPPSFYNDIASSTSGMMFMGDMLANLPITQSSRFLFTVGFGLMARYSDWSVLLKNRPDLGKFDSQELAMGVLGELSATARLTKKFALRADARYIYEKERYAGIGAALLYHY